MEGVLRLAEGKLLGVRYWLDQGTEFLVDHTKRVEYVQAVPSRHIEIYFSERRAIDPRLSCDQAFLYDAIFLVAPLTVLSWGFDVSLRSRPLFGSASKSGLKQLTAVSREVQC